MSDKRYTILPNLTEQIETQVYSEDQQYSASGLSYTFCVDSTHNEVDLNGSLGSFSDLVKSTLKDITPVAFEDIYPTRVGSLSFSSYIYDSESTFRPTNIVTYSCVSINGYSMSTPILTLGIPKADNGEYQLKPISKLGCSEKDDVPYTFFRSSSVLKISAESIQLDSSLYSTRSILGTFLPRDNTTDKLGDINNPFLTTYTKDLRVSGKLQSSLIPKDNNTYDLGSQVLKFKNIYGNLIGDVTGNVTGNLTGNVEGNLTGDVTGDLNGRIPYPVYNDGVLTIPIGSIILCYCTEQRTAGVDLTGTLIGLSSSQNDYWTLLINVDTGNNLFFAKGYYKLPEGKYAVLSGGIAANGDPEKYILLLMKIS